MFVRMSSTIDGPGKEDLGTDDRDVAVTEPAGWRDYGATELPVPLAAALDTFAEHGYHGTSVREIASRANLSVPGLYHHYPSKQSLLQGLLERTMTDLLTRSGVAGFWPSM